MWLFVRKRFTSVLGNLNLTDIQIADGIGKAGGVVSALNAAFWGEEDNAKNSFFVGSWGKGTAIRPPSDVDIFFILPVAVFYDFDARANNKQSQLLQHVKSKIVDRYGQTDIRGDGQVVVVGFNSIVIEVVPAFKLNGGGYYICDTNDGGRWKAVDADQELISMSSEDDRHLGNVRKLTRILKQWKRCCNVPIKGFHIEQLVKEALGASTYSYRDEYWFDWLIRDMFAHMLSRVGGGFYMPGDKDEWISLGSEWKAKAEAAYNIALQACHYEINDMNVSAGLEWQKILGNMVPVEVT